jgi:hypothetical protein
MNAKPMLSEVFALHRESTYVLPQALHHGDRVEILKGGYRGDFATVRSLYNDYLSLTHQSGCILSGFHKNDVRRVTA